MLSTAGIDFFRAAMKGVRSELSHIWDHTVISHLCLASLRYHIFCRFIDLLFKKKKKTGTNLHMPIIIIPFYVTY